MEKIYAILGACLVAQASLWVIKRSLVKRLEKTKSTIDDDLLPPLMKVFLYSAWLGVAIFSLSQLEVINMGPVYGVAGVISLAISQAFASAVKGQASAITAGLQILFFPPFTKGETVTIGSDEGDIAKVTLTHTTIAQKDSAGNTTYLAIANSAVLSSKLGRGRL